MRSLKGGEPRPTKNIIDQRFRSVSPVLRPPRNRQRKRPSRRVSINGCVRSHSFSISIAYAKFRRMTLGSPLPLQSEPVGYITRVLQNNNTGRLDHWNRETLASIGIFCLSY